MHAESQAEFAIRLDVSQPVIARFETNKLDEEIPGPENILIRQFAEQKGIPIPKPNEDWPTFERRATRAIKRAEKAKALAEKSHNEN
jgi:hypothetical protein